MLYRRRRKPSIFPVVLSTVARMIQGTRRRLPNKSGAKFARLPSRWQRFTLFAVEGNDKSFTTRICSAAGFPLCTTASEKGPGIYPCCGARPRASSNPGRFSQKRLLRASQRIAGRDTVGHIQHRASQILDDTNKELQGRS